MARIHAVLDEDEQAARAWQRHKQALTERYMNDPRRKHVRLRREPVTDGRLSEYAYNDRFDPARALAEVAVKRRLVDDLLAEEHLRVDGDEWFSCSQARDKDGELACYNDSRAGLPCDCGRDERVRRRLLLLVEPYEQG